MKQTPTITSPFLYSKQKQAESENEEEEEEIDPNGLFHILLVKLSKSLLTFGAPSYRIEKRIESIAKYYGAPIEIVCEPNCILLSIGYAEKLKPKHETLLAEPEVKEEAEILPKRMKEIKKSSKIELHRDSQTINRRMIETFVIKTVPMAFHMYKLQKLDTFAIKCLNQPPHKTSFKLEFGFLYDSIGQLYMKYFTKGFQPVQSTVQMEAIQAQKDLTVPNSEFTDSQTLLELIKELDSIHAEQLEYGLLWKSLSIGSMAGVICLLSFNGTLIDFFISFLLGCLTGLLIAFGDRFKLRLMEVGASFMISVLGQILGIIFPSSCVGGNLVSSLLPFYPGVAITLAMIEVSSKNMNGILRIFHSFIRCLQLGFGLSLGTRFLHSISRFFEYEIYSPVLKQCDQYEKSGWIYLLLVPFCLGACVQLKADLNSQYLMALLASIGGYLTLKSLLLFGLSLDLASIVSAFVIGMLSNYYARTQNKIALCSTVCGMMLLVPGAVGVYGFFELLDTKGLQNKNSTTDDAFKDFGTMRFSVEVMIRGICLAMGLYLSQALYFPMLTETKKKEKTAAVGRRPASRASSVVSMQSSRGYRRQTGGVELMNL